MDGNIHRRDRTIYVNSIIPSATEDDLFTLFSRAGPIEKVIFKNYEGTPQHALIVFRRLESVMFCLDNKDYFQLKGDPLGIRALKESRHVQGSREGVPHSAGYDFPKDASCFSFDAANVESFRQRSSESESLNSSSTADSWKSHSPSEMVPNDFHLMGPPPPRKFRRAPPPLQLPRQPNMDPWLPHPDRDFVVPHPPFSAGMVNQGRSAFAFNNNFRAPGDIPTWEEFRQMQSPHSPLCTPDNLFTGLSPIGSIPNNNFFGSNFGECPPMNPYGSSYSIDQLGGTPL